MIKDLYILSFYTIGPYLIFLMLNLGKISSKKNFNLEKYIKIKLMVIFFIDL